MAFLSGMNLAKRGVYNKGHILCDNVEILDYFRILKSAQQVKSEMVDFALVHISEPAITFLPSLSTYYEILNI